MRQNRRSGSKPTSFATMKSAKRAFTLIELLVVIAIIAILAAILFPVFAQAREKARQASCASNLKQMSLAIIQYTQDYDETYPIGGLQTPGFWMDQNVTWPKIILPYIKTLAVYRCPSDGKDDPHKDRAWIGAGNTISYSVNSFQRDYAAFGQGANQLVGPFGAPNYAASLGSGSPESKLTRPSDTILMCEVHNEDVAAASNSDAKANASWWAAFPIQYRAGLGWVQATNGNAPDGTATTAHVAGKYRATDRNGNVSVHNNEMSNFAFCDGHVKAMKPEQTNPNYKTNPELNLWDGRRP